MTVNTGGAEQVEIERLHRKLAIAQTNLKAMTELNSNQAATIEELQAEAKLHDIAFDAVQARVEELEEKLHWKEISHAQADERIEELEAALKEFETLKDRFDNGIKYDEELNVYTVRWTERELENAQKAAAEIYEKINWCDPPESREE